MILNKTQDKFLYFYLFALIIFADTYFIISWLMCSTILNYSMVIYFFKKKIKFKLPQAAKKIFYFYYLSSLVIFLINLFQNGVPEAFSFLFVCIPVPIIFYLFFTSSEKFKLIYFYAKTYLVYNLIFSLFQFFDFHVTVGELLSIIPFFGVNEGFKGLSEVQGLRVSGAASSSIGLACNLGIIFFYFYYNKLDLYSRKYQFLFLALIILLAFMSQNRSLLYSMIPVIILTDIIKKGSLKKQIIGVSSIVLITFFSLNYVNNIVSQVFPRLTSDVFEDQSVWNRVQSNYYVAIGTLASSPLIGIPFDKAEEMQILGFQKSGLIIGDFYVDKVTNHNQPLYFFKYYGFLGFTLFLFTYFLLIKHSSSTYNEIHIRKILFSIIIFHLSYSFFHNNKFLNDFFLWFFIALNSINYNKYYAKKI